MPFCNRRQRGLFIAVVALLGCDGEPPGTAMDGGSTTVRDAGVRDARDPGDASRDPDAGPPPGARPHPLYPRLDLATLPAPGGAASGPYEPPALPATTREVTVRAIGTAAARELEAACAAPGTSVEVPDAAGQIGVVNIAGTSDCDIRFGEAVVLEFLVVGAHTGPRHDPVHRVRFRGGQIAAMFVIGGSTDIVFDGVTVNNGVVPSTMRGGSGIFMPRNDSGAPVERFAVVRSVLRSVPLGAGPDFDGAIYLGVAARNVFFAANNIATAGNRGSWAFRIGGGDNTILVDNAVRVSMHKLVRMNDEPVDYVYILRGLWMREATPTSSGDVINDSFQQLMGSTTHNVFVHDPTVYLLAGTPVGFGMSWDPMQRGLRWEARRIEWHAQSSGIISDARLDEYAGYVTSMGGGIADYGVGTHSYHYDPAVRFPDSPWIDLPDIRVDDPDLLPTLP